MFSAYFVFHCLNMFCVEKQVSEFFVTHLATCLWLVRLMKIFATHLATRQSCNASGEFIQKLSQLISRLAPRNSFLKSFSWETCFKPLSSSLKPLFQYFYIKTQSIWMVFHFINFSKVILNSFLWFWSLDYVLESFCALGWDFHHRGWGDLFFLSNFCMGLVSFDDFLWMLALYGKKELVLRMDFMTFMHCFTLLFIVCTLCVW